MKRMAGLVLIALGVIIIIGGAILLLNKEDNKTIYVTETSIAKPEEQRFGSKSNRELPEQTVLTKKENNDFGKSSATSVSKPQSQNIGYINESKLPEQAKSAKEIEAENKKKGYDFEKYVVQKFNKEYFILKEWTGDKYTNGIYAPNSLNLDLVFEFYMKHVSQKFAVECKWRKEFYENSIEIATSRQLENYRAFSNEKVVPVFITIGVGGEPTLPKYLYVVPLDEIVSNKLNRSFLKTYEQFPGQSFFFDYKAKSLTAKPYKLEQEKV